MLLAADPMLNAADLFAAACHERFAAVSCRVAQTLDGDVAVRLDLALDPPPSERGHLTVRLLYAAGDLAALRVSRETDESAEWLPEHITLDVDVRWSSAAGCDVSDADAGTLLGVAEHAIARHSVQANVWVREQTVRSTRAALVGGPPVSDSLVVGAEDHLTLGQVLARDWAAFAEQLAVLVDRLHHAAVA